jgi:hypothetical protein
MVICPTKNGMFYSYDVWVMDFCCTYKPLTKWDAYPSILILWFQNHEYMERTSKCVKQTPFKLFNIINYVARYIPQTPPQVL